MAILTRTTNTVETNKKITIKVDGLGDDALISLQDLPKSLVDMTKYIKRSPSKIGTDGKERGNKVMPVGEEKFTVEFTMDDGTITSIDICMTAWLNKDHVVAAENAVEAKAKKDAEDKAQKAAMEAKEKYFARFTPEELLDMSKLGLLK